MIKLRNLERFTFRVLSGCCVLAASAFTVHAQPLTFTTLAGPLGGGRAGDGTGSAARFSYPEGMAIDGGGNLYVADWGNRTIRKITPAGVVTTLAGLAGYRGSADGTGGTARFAGPAGVATDSGGNVYVADYGNETIRKITPSGVVTTLAGLAGQFGSADGTGSTARFSSPYGVATDSGGNVYVADCGNNTIRKITPAGVVTTLAGLADYFGGTEDGTGSTARFSGPTGVATDSGGNVYVSDYYSNTIRKITPAGVVTTLAGGSHALYADGTGSAASFDGPAGMATDSGGNVYVSDYFNNTIRKITPAGVVTTLAGIWFQSGSADGTGSAARFDGPWGVAADRVGNVYVADQLNNTIRKITPAGVVTTFAGSAVPSRGADGTGSSARFASPMGVATDRGGNLYVADTSNSTIRKITPAGVVTTLAGLAGFAGNRDGTGSAARFNVPWGVATDSGGNVYVGDYYNDTIRKITPAGVVTTLAGGGSVFDPPDGTGSAARFYHPMGVATDSGGNVYVAEPNAIRKITPDGLVTTLASSLAADAGSEGVATDSGGNVYVADNYRNTIRKMTPAGVVTTFAGLEGVAGSQDGTGSAARFSGPSGVATDSGGNVYVADTGNHAIRKITPAGLVTTLGGSPGLNGDADGTGSTARFGGPSGVAIDSGGNVYVADSYNDRICVGRPALADAATIDLSTGTVGTTRQLTTTTQTATSWYWTLILQPYSSRAQLSSTSTRNALFTPDVAGLYIIQLTASNGVNTSITTVSLTAERERFRSAPSDGR